MPYCKSTEIPTLGEFDALPDATGRLRYVHFSSQFTSFHPRIWNMIWSLSSDLNLSSSNRLRKLSSMSHQELERSDESSAMLVEECFYHRNRFKFWNYPTNLLDSKSRNVCSYRNFLYDIIVMHIYAKLISTSSSWLILNDTTNRISSVQRSIWRLT